MYKKIIFIFLAIFIFSACQTKKEEISDEESLFLVNCGRLEDEASLSATCFIEALNNNCRQVKIKSANLNTDNLMFNQFQDEEETKYTKISTEKVNNDCYINIIESDSEISCVYDKSFFNNYLDKVIEELVENSDFTYTELLADNELRLSILYEMITLMSKQGYNDCIFTKSESNQSNWRVISYENTNKDIFIKNDYLYLLKIKGIREDNNHFIIEKYKEGVKEDSFKSIEFDNIYRTSSPKIFLDHLENIYIYNLNLLFDINLSSSLYIDLDNIDLNPNLLLYNKNLDNWYIYEKNDNNIVNINNIQENKHGIWFLADRGRLFLYNNISLQDYSPKNLGIDELRRYENMAVNDDFMVVYSTSHAIEIYNQNKFETNFFARRSNFNYSEISDNQEIYFLDLNKNITKLNLESQEKTTLETVNDFSDCLYLKDSGLWCYLKEDNNFIVYNFYQDNWQRLEYLDLKNIFPKKIIKSLDNLYILCNSGTLFELTLK